VNFYLLITDFLKAERAGGLLELNVIYLEGLNGLVADGF
jgi:hypothetical protein